MTRGRRCVTSVEEAEQLAADGVITVADLDEVRRFSEFLAEVGSPRDSTKVHAAMHRHYPDDLRAARLDAGLPAECGSECSAGTGSGGGG